MAVLSDLNRAELHALFMRAGDETGPVSGVLKADIRAAINGADDYLNTNAAAMNTAIPQPARSALTSAQKALIYQLVIERRYVAGA